VEPDVERSGGRLLSEGLPADARRKADQAARLAHDDRGEILRRDPDHAGAVAELRQLAAELGAEALLKVGYTIWEGKSYYGGVRIKGWVYHALAVRWEPRT